MKASFSTSFECRPMTKNELPQVLDFIRDVFPPNGHQNIKGWFEWQYLKYPYGFHVQICCDNEKIVAMSGFLPVIIYANGQKLSAAFSTNTIVHPSYRRQGLGGRLHKARLESYDIALSSGQSKANRNLYAKLGWKILGTYFNAMACKRPSDFFPLKWFGKQVVAWGKWVIASQSIRRPVHLIDDEEQVLNFVEKCKFIRFPEAAYGPIHSADYVYWRYKKHPYFQYRMVLVKEGKEELGVIVFRSSEGQWIIVDIYGPNKNIVRLLTAFTKESPVNILRATAVGGHLHKCFQKAGWIVRPSDSLLIGQSMSSDIKNILEKGDWIFYAGDSDKDR